MFCKNHIALLAGALLLMAWGTDLAAQSRREETLSFQQAAGVQTVLLRGKQAARYDFPANGNPYWSSPEYRTGDIEIEGRRYCDIPFNIDAVAQRLLVRVGDSQVAVSVPPSRVSAIDLGERHFRGVGPDGPLPEGFYEVIGNGPEQVYKNVSKVLNSSPDNVNGDAIGYRDPNYRTDVSRYFALRRNYYFRDAGGQFRRIKGKSALLRCLGPRKKEVRQALSAGGMERSGVDFDLYCRMALDLAGR